MHKPTKVAVLHPPPLVLADGFLTFLSVLMTKRPRGHLRRHGRADLDAESCGHVRGGRVHARRPASPGLRDLMWCRGARAERLAGQISDKGGGVEKGFAIRFWR